MASSIEDINLIITSRGKTAYYAGLKGCGNLIVELKFGLYSNRLPKPERALDFINNTDWEDCIESLDEPLQSPVYGDLHVNFDTKEILVANSYGYPNEFSYQWIQYSVRDMLAGRDGYLSASTIKAHLKNKRLWIEKEGDLIQLPSQPEEFLNYFKDNEPPFGLVEISLPTEWTIHEQ